MQADEEDTDAVVDTEVRRMRAVVQCTTEDLQRTHTQLAVVQAELQQHLMELQQHLIELQQELQQHLPVHVSQQWHIPVVSIKNPHAALMYHSHKKFELRTTALLRPFEGQYMLLHVSKSPPGRPCGDTHLATSTGVPSSHLDATRGCGICLMHIGQTQALRANTKRAAALWQRRLFVADARRLKKGFVTHIRAVHRLTADIHLRGFLHVHSTRVAQTALPSSIDIQVLEHTNASEVQRQARLAAQRRRA